MRLNRVLGNQEDGIFFRNETEGMAGHRNRLEENVIENNGSKREAAGIRIRGETKDVVLKSNIIRDTRAPGERKQATGILIEEAAGPVVLDNNTIEASVPVKDQRKKTGDK